MKRILTASCFAVVLTGHGLAAISSENSIEVPASTNPLLIEQQYYPSSNSNDTYIYLAALTENATSSISNTLRQGTAECSSLPAVYRADCAAQAYDECSVSTTGRDYRKAKFEIRGVARRLNALVSQNEDKEAELLVRGDKTYRAIKKSAVQAVNRKAIKIIVEAETKLLRTSGNGARKVHYQRIAQAVNSTKIIFRS